MNIPPHHAEAWESMNPMARKRRLPHRKSLPGRPVLADNFPLSAHNQFMNNDHSRGTFLISDP